MTFDDPFDPVESSLPTEMKALMDQLQELELMRRQLDDAHAAAREALTDLDKKSKDISYLKKQVAAKDKRISFYMKQIAYRDKEIAFNRAEIDRLREQL